ncbi:hypothetical protein D3C73_618510 [compost metagenome]
MKWVSMLVLTLIVVAIVFIELPELKGRKRETWSFFGFLLTGWFVSVMLVFKPDLPGPTDWVQALFKPIGQMLKK